MRPEPWNPPIELSKKEAKIVKLIMGHALKKALSVIACQQGRELTAIAGEMEADLLIGSSLKAACLLELGKP